MPTIPTLMDRLALQEGFNDTFIPEIKIYKRSTPQPLEPMSYKQGALFVGQGSKQVFLYGQCHEYNPDNYLVLSVTLPAECRTTPAPGKPLLMLTLDFDFGLLSEISAQAHHHGDTMGQANPAAQKGLVLGRSTREIKQTLTRLLTCLQSPLEASILGRGLVKELLFRIMQGEAAPALFALTAQNTNIARIDKALRLIHSDFTQAIAIEDLATMVNMSPSVFHRVFKEVTASTPLQYIKKIRLNHARGLLGEGLRVGETAQRVGYESPSQFSREFKKHFGTTPAEIGRGLGG
ncbi:MAG: AraC family transcriptional regulator [Desulfovibrionales bacterium]|nr:AraC family transcriptional regulator [Desulfovibrionales bacterium]